MCGLKYEKVCLSRNLFVIHCNKCLQKRLVPANLRINIEERSTIPVSVVTIILPRSLLTEQHVIFMFVLKLFQMAKYLSTKQCRSKHSGINPRNYQV